MGKRSVESRLADLEAEDETDADVGVVIAYYDEETDTYYDFDGNPLDTDHASLMVVVSTDGPPEGRPFGREEA